MIDKDFFWTSA